MNKTARKSTGLLLMGCAIVPILLMVWAMAAAILPEYLRREYPEASPALQWAAQWSQIAASMIPAVITLALIFTSCKWVVKDANIRGRPGWVAGILVLLTWPIGLLLWLVVRPEIPKELPPLTR